MSHDVYMRRCLALAQASAERGETPVGALVVRVGQVIGEGGECTRTLLDPAAHAELQAIRAACQREHTLDLAGATLFTTVEPCVLCGYAIRRTGISCVVYGVPAGQAGAFTSGYAIASDAALAGWPPLPEVVSGVLEEACRALLEARARR
jgi:tRNA(adenine34) deaminase